MSIANYNQLKTAVAHWLNRSNLTDRIPEFITLAHSRIHYGSMEAPLQSDPLRIRAMETSVYTSINAQRIELPDGYLQSRRFYLNSTPKRVLKLVTTDQFWTTWVSDQTGPPKEFCIEGEDLVIGPTPDATYTGEFLYYKAFDAFSDETDTNWLLLNAPNAYLWGALIEGHSFARNPAEAMNAWNKFTGVINSLMFADKNDRFSGSPWVIMNDTGNPP